mgnify:FL=1
MSEYTFNVQITHTYDQTFDLEEARELLGRPDADAAQILELLDDRETWTQAFDQRMADASEMSNSDIEIDADYEGID